MKTKIYSIFDLKVGAYNFPFTMRSNGEALRAFADMAKDPSNRIGQHPEDYSLYAVGEFDDERGIVSPLTPHETLGKAVELVQVPTAPLSDAEWEGAAAAKMYALPPKREAK